MTSRNSGNASMRQVVGTLIAQIGQLSAMLGASHEDCAFNYSKFLEAVKIIEGLRCGVADIHQHVVGEKTREEAAASLGTTLERYRNVRHFHPDLVALEEELTARPTKRVHLETQTDAACASVATERVDAFTETEPQVVTLSSKVKYNLVIRLADGTTYTY